MAGNGIYMVNGRKHVPAEKIYIESVAEGQVILRVRNAIGGLYSVLSLEGMRDISRTLTTLADEIEAGAAAQAEAAIKKAMGNL